MHLRTVFIFTAGAVVGYCVSLYYADLLWVADASVPQKAA